jgi:hypothetical protein
VNIVPDVSILSVLRHMDYKWWFAIAEFVDNSVQSHLSNRNDLEVADGGPRPVVVEIEFDHVGGGTLVVRDNAAGIRRADFDRAFKPAAAPPDSRGLSEFGMGMKSASCWCGAIWSVRTSALHEPDEYRVAFDVQEIIRGHTGMLPIQRSDAPATAHFTEIKIEHLHNPPATKTIGKIKSHLASIYRRFIKSGALVLKFNGDPLAYEEPDILEIPYFEDEAGPPIEWRREINFPLGNGMEVRGFAAIRAVGSTRNPGFALFRRGRVIEGSGEEGYRPEYIFGRGNSFESQRLFGELDVSGFEVSHTKNGFQWDENEEPFLELLREHLDAKPSFLKQINGHHPRRAKKDATEIARKVGESAALALEKDAGAEIARVQSEPPAPPRPTQLEAIPLLTERAVEIPFRDTTWVVRIELTNDPGVGDWLQIADRDADSQGGKRTLTVRMSLSHPFVLRFGGASGENTEPLLRLALGVAIGEMIALDSGSPADLRRNLNELLRAALSVPGL